jgi:hypothetical protein
MINKPESENTRDSLVSFHTLSSGEIAILPGESEHDLDELENELDEQFEPKSNTEQFLVDQMVHARWKLARVRRLEVQAYADLIHDEKASDSHILEALEKPRNIFDKLERMALAADRAFAKALRELNLFRANVQKSHKQSEIQNEAKPANTRPPAQPAEPTHATITPYAARPVQNEPNPVLPEPEDTAPRL